MSAAALLAVNDSLLNRDGILIILGGGAGLLAILGLLLLLPLYLTQHAEVERLLDWMEHEPDAGTTEFRAIDPHAAPPRSGGRMTPAERVTAERPALARISTAEHDALALTEAPLWRRVLDRGPRHPLVLTILALIAAVAALAAAGILIRSGDGDDSGRRGGGIAPGDISVAVVNGGDASGSAGDIDAALSKRGFDVTATAVSSAPISDTQVQYAPGEKRSASRVIGVLSLAVDAEEFDAAGEAAADGADVVVIVGEDMAAADGGKA